MKGWERKFWRNDYYCRLLNGGSPESSSSSADTSAFILFREELYYFKSQ